VTHPANDTTLEIAGHEVPRAQWNTPVLVDAGQVDVVTKSGGKEASRKSVRIALGDKAAVAIDAQPASAPEPSENDALSKSDTTPQPEAPQSSKTSLRTYAYVAGGIGVAGLATFAILGSMSSSKFDDLQGVCKPTCPASKADEISSGRTQQTIANVGLGLGLAGVAAGATLFFLGAPASAAPASSTGFVVAPGYVGVRGSL
jgi:hypothetical protein